MLKKLNKKISLYPISKSFTIPLFIKLTRKMYKCPYYPKMGPRRPERLIMPPDYKYVKQTSELFPGAIEELRELGVKMPPPFWFYNDLDQERAISQHFILKTPRDLRHELVAIVTESRKALCVAGHFSKVNELHVEAPLTAYYERLLTYIQVIDRRLKSVPPGAKITLEELWEDVERNVLVHTHTNEETGHLEYEFSIRADTMIEDSEEPEKDSLQDVFEEYVDVANSLNLGLPLTYDLTQFKEDININGEYYEAIKTSIEYHINAMRAGKVGLINWGC